DHWSDAPETFDGHAHDTIHEEILLDGADDHVDLDFGTRPKLTKVPTPPAIDSTVGPSPTSDSLAQPVFDNASSHSLPTVQVTEPRSPVTPQAHSAQVSSFPQASLENARSHLRAPVTGSSPSPTPSRRSLAHPRPAIVETARSPNRLSGFFSNLIHRRDGHGPVPPSPLSSTANDRAATPEGSGNASRASSPAPPRPATPPPCLPPPTLQELGLSLSVLTSDLSPSHFSTPPASGAFLSPHHLLLCHAQGLDVLPLVSPPAPQPYALIRRVPFKSVVVMEHRGVIVAIAGRRDGVRVYALDEVKKAVEWRLDVEIRRERERARREEAKRGGVSPRGSASIEKHSVPALSPAAKAKSLQRSSSFAATPSPRPPRKKSKTPPPAPTVLRRPPTPPQGYHSPPPSYRSPSPARLGLRAQSSAISLVPRRGSVTNVLGGALSRRGAEGNIAQTLVRDGSEKPDWQDASDDEEEAINALTAGPSGSQALDERTSAMAASSSTNSNLLTNPSAHQSRRLSTATLTPSSRRRPPELDLDAIGSTPVGPAPPSPTPTLLTLRQALMASPPSRPARPRGPLAHEDDGSAPSEDEEAHVSGGRTPTNERITFAEALQESRMPDLPPPGSTVPQDAILITNSHPIATSDEDMPPASPTNSARTRQSVDTQESTLTSRRRRRRWSIMDSIFTSTPSLAGAPAFPTSRPFPDSASAMSAASLTPSAPVRRPQSASGSGPSRAVGLSRSHSSMRMQTGARAVSAATTGRPSTAGGSISTTASTQNVPPLPTPPSRFLSRIIGSAFGVRRSEDRGSEIGIVTEARGDKKASTAPASATPAPKLEYVKLPGTKSALLIKAVETNKKSFLAILCGDNGEKVELFAGTYRTALGLSRTFILPDSPRSLELQLQGDDLVEVFLVFTQNVFGLEPATVRVREVRIGRAERRAARRRARELRGADDPQAVGADVETAPVEETTTVTVTVGVDPTAPAIAAGHEVAAAAGTVAAAGAPVNAASDAAQDELLAVAAAQMGPYTTFQQLPFSPNFPLAAIADEYIIPPTYPDFLDYRSQHEPERDPDVDLSQLQFTPPGLPVPPPPLPSNWYYQDPKGKVHGPWEAARMEMWYKDGLLPIDLPVRREEETMYMLLKDLRQQAIDPTQPFKSAPPLRSFPVEHSTPVPVDAAKPLLDPLSLLRQSRIFGPPALFYSTRGGHSTLIVDGRGRSVLKGRFVWTHDEEAEPVASGHGGRLGDVKRLEAFDVADRSVLVAMRQGGFEAVDFSDALLKPADASRHYLPQFTTTPSQVNRRSPFTWKIGMPVSTASHGPTSLLPLKGHSKLLHAPGKKHSTGPGKTPGRAEFGADGGDTEHTRDEVVYLGRRDDDVYICERNGGAFRILRLGPA
ncbi:hypothetical protein K488DRAFT_34045, partial [Vararia minispora EC-137]